MKQCCEQKNVCSFPNGRSLSSLLNFNIDEVEGELGEHENFFSESEKRKLINSSATTTTEISFETLFLN